MVDWGEESQIEETILEVMKDDLKEMQIIKMRQTSPRSSYTRGQAQLSEWLTGRELLTGTR